EVTTAVEIKNIDRRAILEMGVPGIVLMENAGVKVLEKIGGILGKIEGKEIIIFCGKGNNGGDGLVVARHLLYLNATVSVYIVGNRSEIKGDPLKNLEIYELDGGKACYIKGENDIPFGWNGDLIVDALLGTGIEGPIKGLFNRIIDFINSSNAKVISIDIPSGVETDTGLAHGKAVKADYTVTMGLLKRCHLLYPGKELSGEVEVADIGFPKIAVEKEPIKTFFIEREDITPKFPNRPPDAYKHACGKVLVISGSRGMTGAAVLVSRAVLKSGAGLVICGIAESLHDIMEVKLTEEMTFPVKGGKNGELVLSSYEDIKDKLEWADSIAVGPGLGRHPETKKLLKKIFEHLSIPAVVDADALILMKDELDDLKSKPLRLIITPHTGELAQMLNLSMREIAGNRVEIVRRLAEEKRLTVILKGAPTIIGSTDGEIFINGTGNPGMATAGSGDVLTGILASFLAQGMNELNASIAGVYVHGLAGDLAATHQGVLGMTSGDILSFLPEVLKDLKK
ncbi:MAG: NAD(P)H-hydrate dehydratase, partial [Fidelibacterota bacterium]